jgi:dTDP-4-amino-4,6-dideoxygalactose transaminase
MQPALEVAISSDAKAIVQAQTRVSPLGLEAITSLHRKCGLWLIEDWWDISGSTD